MPPQQPPIAVALHATPAHGASGDRARRHVVAAAGRNRRRPVRLAERRPLHRHRQRLCEGRPGLYRHRDQRSHRRGGRAREPERVARPAPVPARRPALPHGAGQDRGGDRDPARRDPRPARPVAHQARGDQGRAKPAELRPGRLRPPEGPRRSQVRAGGEAGRVAHGPRGGAPAHRLGARRTCSASRRRWPAIPRSRSTIIPR